MPGALTGLIPACHTPFDRAGHLNLSIVEQQSALFRESGLRCVFVAGTTGEFASLTVSERKALCERWVAVAGDSLAVALHVGSNCQADSIELAAHARKAGVAAVAAIAPSYFKPATVPDLIDFLAPIAAEAGPLPFYYYHIPCMTNVRLPAAEVLREARGRIPNLRGLKFSHDDMVDLQGCIAAEGEILWVGVASMSDGSSAATTGSEGLRGPPARARSRASLTSAMTRSAQAPTLKPDSCRRSTMFSKRCLRTCASM